MIKKRPIINPPRIYLDTSVLGGILDEEFQNSSKRLMKQIHAGQFRPVLSPLIEREITNAPEPIRRQYDALALIGEMITVSPEAILLQEAYLSAKIVTPKWETDALHVALAVSSGCQMIINHLSA